METKTVSDSNLWLRSSIGNDSWKGSVGPIRETSQKYTVNKSEELLRRSTRDNNRSKNVFSFDTSLYNGSR